ncbi:MAG: IclR family transcriptional regulator [Acidimicrobiia bacterium]|nr:IclR family transcriptional regulator [Acidimicrobiia bacterium]
MGTTVTAVRVIDKAVTLIEVLRDGGGHTLGTAGAAAGLPRATTHRLLTALEAHGLVRRDHDGRYQLGLGLAALGRAALDAFPLAEQARPELARLAEETGESTQLFVADREGRRCVVSVQSPHGLRWIVPEGALLPLGVGSAGRILAPSGGTSDVVRNGWLESVEEREPGVASVSAAVRERGGRTIAAISVSGPLSRLTDSPGLRFGPAVLECAKRVGHRLTA